MTEEVWILRTDLCRCCLSEGQFKNMGIVNCGPLGEDELYVDMLREQLGIEIRPVEGVMEGITYTICDPCVIRLREAINFKKQVILSEERFQNLLIKNLIRVPETFVKDEIEDSLEACDVTDDFNEETASIKADDSKDISQLETALREGSGKKNNKSKQKKPTKTKAENGKKKKNDSNTDSYRGPKASKFGINEADYEIEGKSSFRCKLCNKKYSKMSLLAYHVQRIHYKIPRFACQYCPAKLMTATSLVVHKLEEHNIDERQKCNACKGTFNNKVQLRKHINIFHMMGEKYKCEFCDFESFSIEGVHKHKFKHKTVKDYHCRFCKKAFLRKSTLQLHERIHTGDRRKVCEVCDKAFVQKASLNYHMTKYHPEVNF